MSASAYAPSTSRSLRDDSFSRRLADALHNLRQSAKLSILMLAAIRLVFSNQLNATYVTVGQSRDQAAGILAIFTPSQLILSLLLLPILWESLSPAPRFHQQANVIPIVRVNFVLLCMSNNKNMFCNCIQ